LLGQGPHWLNAVLTALVVTGLASRKELGRLLVVVLAYTAAFAVVGKPWDWYWGIIYLPLLAIGLGHAFAAVTGLVRASLTPVPAAAHAGSQE
jgi:cyanate permease